MVLFLFMVNKNLLIIYLYVARQIIYLYHLKHHQVGGGGATLNSHTVLFKTTNIGRLTFLLPFSRKFTKNLPKTKDFS